MRSFSSYKTKKDLSEVLCKYDSNDITSIPPFILETEKIDDNDEELEYCVIEIKHKMRNLGPTTERNKAVHCKYIALYCMLPFPGESPNKGSL